MLKLRYLNGPNELIMIDEEIEIRLGNISCEANGRVRNHVAVPTAAFTVFSAVCGLECTHTLRLIATPVVAEERVLRMTVHTEPSTELDCKTALMEFMDMGCYDQGEAQRTIRNEVRMQCTAAIQQNWSATVTVLAGASYGSFLALPCGKQAEWVGDRHLTCKYVFKDEDDLVRVMGSPRILGWRLPMPTNKRKKSTGGRYLLPFMHGDFHLRAGPSNCITYCLETHRLEVRLALALYGENLAFIRGAMPPPQPSGNHAFDIVTRKWVVPVGSGEPWTSDRADKALNGMDGV